MREQKEQSPVLLFFLFASSFSETKPFCFNCIITVPFLSISEDKFTAGGHPVVSRCCWFLPAGWWSVRFFPPGGDWCLIRGHRGKIHIDRVSNEQF